MLFKAHVLQCHWRAQVKIPMYGCDCYAYGLLAAGHCDLVVEADLKPYDFMALVPVVRARPYPPHRARLYHASSADWSSTPSLHLHIRRGKSRSEVQ